MNDQPDLPDRDLDALNRHLDAYGPDMARWPLHSQQQFVALLTSDARAQQLWQEAKAIEALVSKVLVEPVPDPSREQIDRLQRLHASVMAAAATGHGAASSYEPFSTGPMREALARRSASRSMAAVAGWPAYAALAASLVLGLLAGTLGIADRSLERLQVVGWGDGPSANGVSDDDVDDELAFDTGLDGLEEENTL